MVANAIVAWILAIGFAVLWWRARKAQQAEHRLNMVVFQGSYHTASSEERTAALDLLKYAVATLPDYDRRQLVDELSAAEQ